MADINIPALISEYDAGASMRELAAQHRISPQRVRRILIDAGVYTNTTTLYAQKRLEDGASLDQIAEELNISKNALLGNLPHTKGVYGQSNASANAKRIRALRRKKQEEKTHGSQ